VCLIAIAGEDKPVERWGIPPALLGEVKLDRKLRKIFNMLYRKSCYGKVLCP
jgi:hypothetical protein